MITPEHRAFLHAQALTDDVLEQHGVTSVTSAKDLPEGIAWAGEQCPTGILFPWTTDAGTVTQYRPDKEYVKKDGKPAKYLFPAGSGSFTGKVRDPQDDGMILVVEGTKQSLAADAWAPKEWGIYGIPGCQNWTGSSLSWAEGRDVVILFDADWTTNRDVFDAAVNLAEALEIDGGAESVKYARLVNAKSKDGLDDVLAARAESERTKYITRIVKAAKSKLGRPPARKPDNIFFDKRGGLMAKTASEAVLDGQPAALAKGSQIALYRDGVFRVDQGREPLYAAVQKLLGEEYRPNWRSTIEESLIGILSADGTVLPEKQAEPLLNCKNGMLDLRTGKLSPHMPSYLSRVQIPVNWEPNAKAPYYEKWIAEYCPGQVDDIEESLSVMLDPSRTPAKAVFLFGPSRSGKSTILRIAMEIAGSNNTSGVDLHQLSGDRFASANVYGKMLNSSADLSAEHLADTSLFKRMTGGDVIQGNRKYGQEFQFTSTALFAFSANTVPTVSEASRAYLERIKPFSFPVSFAGREDPTVEDKLLAELPGILVRWLKAWQRMQDRGGYLPTLARVSASFEAASDRVSLWLQRNAVVVPEAIGKLVGADEGTGKTELYTAFKLWLTAEGGAGAMKRSDFLNRLESLQGVGETRLKHRSKNIGLNIVVVSEDEKDKLRTLPQEETDQDRKEGGVLKVWERSFSAMELDETLKNQGEGVVVSERHGGDRQEVTLPHSSTPSQIVTVNPFI
jgi:putative DNA primase/helicase